MRLSATLAVLGMSFFFAFGLLALGGAAAGLRWLYAALSLGGLVVAIGAYRRLRSRRYDRLMEDK